MLYIFATQEARPMILPTHWPDSIQEVQMFFLSESHIMESLAMLFLSVAFNPGTLQCLK